VVLQRHPFLRRHGVRAVSGEASVLSCIGPTDHTVAHRGPHTMTGQTARQIQSTREGSRVVPLFQAGATLCPFFTAAASQLLLTYPLCVWGV
jgi:hypothetical protein